MKQHTVVGGDGIELNVEETGNPDGQPILFIHGYTQSRLSWTKQIESDLADDFRLVAMDDRGHGESEKPEDAYDDSELWAEDVQGTIETLDLTLSNTSEHSFGFNSHDWRLDRYSGDGWTKVAPEGVAEPWTNVAPNGQYEYELTTQQHPSPANGPHQIDVDLTSDVYALSIVGNWDTGRNGKRIECIALINVVVMSKESWPTPTTTPDP